ncbi:hypothetical protein EIP86_004369 [Pleurotus ostreatoroseus]|nr:hypothetical protein EIP86_004369 [Pleurotus ostreatoroseus]
MKTSIVDGARFWALLIGINDYYADESLQLRGACADALAVYEYLTDNLHVPSGNINLFLTESRRSKTAEAVENAQSNTTHPTRETILNALYDLRDNPDIRRSDNILLYFAGRGSRYHASPLGVEALSPADRGCTPAGSSDLVHDISDRELSTIFQEIREAKGDCITVITDSCHTAGGEHGKGLRNVRHVMPLAGVDADLLLSVSHSRKRSAGSYASPTWDWDTSSCVPLSATLTSGWAKEAKFDDSYHGYFTRALLALLKHKAHSSYYDLCQDMREYMPKSRTSSRPLQVPSAVGDRRHCAPWFIDRTQT